MLKATEKTARLRQLIQRRDKVLAVLHPPTAAHARIMEKAGCEVGFVGTGGVVGTYTGLADVGTMTMTECIQVGQWIAHAVDFPVILDGDTGHGGIMAVRRLIKEALHAGLAGIRIDDQPIEGKRKTRGQAQDAKRRCGSGADRTGGRPLSHRGRHEERDRPQFRRDGAMLRARCGEQQLRGHAAAAQGLSGGRWRRLGAARITTYDR